MSERGYAPRPATRGHGHRGWPCSGVRRPTDTLLGPDSAYRVRLGKRAGQNAACFFRRPRLSNMTSFIDFSSVLRGPAIMLRPIAPTSSAVPFGSPFRQSLSADMTNIPLVRLSAMSCLNGTTSASGPRLLTFIYILLIYPKTTNHSSAVPNLDDLPVGL